jgi:hypothetical protein
VPRNQLGKIVPRIGDRKFTSIAQAFLHEYGQIIIEHIEIVAPYVEHPSDCRPRVRAWKKHCPWRVKLADAQMPANVKHINSLLLRFG